MEENRFLKGFLAGLLTCPCVIMLAVLIMSAAGVLNLTGLTGITAGKYAALEKKIINKVNLLEVYIDEYFLDDIDEEKMADSVYKGVIDGLGDDYAAYYTAEEYQDIQEKTEGIYCGIGAYLSADTQSGAITVVKPMKNSPAEKAGVKAGDIIYAVDGKEVSNMEISQVQALVKGEQGSEVKLTLLRKEKKVEVTVTRDEIVEDTVSSKLLDGKIGYIQVTSFEKVTAKQFRAAIKKLEKKGEEGLIIDLRNNGGGLLDTAVDMLDRMLPEGVVVYSKDKSGKKQEYKAEDPDKFDKPLVILVNGNSASASEVFCGAIQDEKAGVLLGTTTFGKGIVQGVFSLDDGSAVKMTTAKYYTPKGRNIHGKGLTPDVEVELTDEEETLPVSGKKVDNQLKAAYDYLTQK
jgi:carboxyl-terminal processing protease